MKKIVFLIMLLACLSSYAQQTDTTYHNQYGLKCDADTAHFFQVVTDQGEQQQVIEYFTSNNQIRSKGLETKGEPQNKRQGLWETFYENGNPKTSVTYQSGAKVGTSKEWFENGQQEAIWKHDNGNTTLVSSWAFDGTSMVKAGEGKYEKQFPGGQVHYGGAISSGKQTGLWQAMHNNGQKMHQVMIQGGLRTGTEEIWNREGQKIFEKKYPETGTLVTTTFWNDAGELMHSAQKNERRVKSNWIGLGTVEPEPINMSEVQQAIGYPDVARDAGIEGMLVVQVLVNEKGEILKEKWIREVNPILKEAVQKQLYTLNFTPAIQSGKFIKFWVNIPFRFQLVENKKKKKGRG
jgi:TonB family protein